MHRYEDVNPHTHKRGGGGGVRVAWHQVSLFFSKLSLDEEENNEVIPIVYTQHSHTDCMPLYTQLKA